MNESVASIGTPEASELLLCQDPRLTCETYIFEPSAAETALGHLYAVGETEDRNGIGKELLDMTIQALQREYYRDPTRSLTASFESALHQANIVLHDAAEQGVRDWMGYWHVAVGVVAETSLHISTAGNGLIFLVRKGKATLLTEDLSYSPITDPLRTFSQVASGALAARDVLFLGTSAFSTVFRREDLLRFSIEHSAATISTRLNQLYADQQSTIPLVAMVISILPNHIATARPTTVTDTVPLLRRERRQPHLLAPRQPLVIHRTALRALFALLAQVTLAISRWLKERVWPLVVRGSREGGRAVVSVSVLAGRNVQSVTRQSMSRFKTRDQLSPAPTVVKPTRTWPSPRVWGQNILRWLISLPITSKIFAVIAVVLAVVLIASLILLQTKRTADTTIQQASETLHAAETKLSAAETALIYDNRDQARNLLNEATTDVTALQNQKVYVEETQKLMASIGVMQDRLQKVVRASTITPRTLGDFSSLSKKLAGLTAVDGRIFSFNGETNEIFAMTDTGETSVVSKTSEGIGALHVAVPHVADKNIVFITNAPGVALFDTKLTTLSPQDISWAKEQPAIAAASVYGSRLYIVETAPDNIYSYNKTLRGYSGGAPWITTKDFPASTIVSLAVDGNIYTLHSDGSVHQLFKGEAVDFELEAVDPPLAGATKIFTTEGAQNIYVFDPAHTRVVVFTKKGVLVQQIVLDVAQTLVDMAVAGDEQTLYVLDGTKVLALPLSGE